MTATSDVTTPTARDEAARLVDVSVDYPSPTGPVAALRHVTVAFPRASCTAIVGRSGSGKSTLVSVLALLRAPTGGQVILDGQPVGDLDVRRVSELRAQGVGIVFQAFHLDQALTARENVLLPWFFRARGLNRPAARARAGEILGQLGIGELADRRPNEMSGGQRQRVAIGRALFARPALFVADEPTGNLDEDTAAEVTDVLLSLPATFGTTVVLVTHDATVAAAAHHRLELVRGELAAGDGLR